MKTLYKSLPKNMAPHGHKFFVGKWYKEERAELCECGFHASEKAFDAMCYVDCEVMAKVSVKGESDIGDDKQCWTEMRIDKIYKWTKKDSVALSTFAAELVIKNYEKLYPNDKRPREAIEAAKKVLKNDTEANRSAARSAESAAESAAWSARSAESAAESAAWSARFAARSAEFAARSAAWSARSAESAAESAAWSARSAARSARSAESAALKKIEKFIHDRIGF